MNASFREKIRAMAGRLARIGDRIGDGLDRLLENFPRLRQTLTRLARTSGSLLKLLSSSALYAGMIATLVWGYNDWGELSGLQKSALIVDSVEIFGRTLQYLPDFLRQAGGVLDEAFAGWDAYEQMSAKVGEAFNNFATSVDEAAGKAGSSLLSRWNRFFNAEGAVDEVAVAESRLATLTTPKLLSGFLEVVGVVAG